MLVCPVLDKFTPELALQGYRAGLFPMVGPGGDLYWCTASPRCIFDYEHFHVPRSLRPVLHRQQFETRVNTAFANVIRACADRAEGTWITPEIIAVYCELHARGYAHSIESWREGKLVGGLYGVALGAAFFGESMFFYQRDASKVALVALIERLEERRFTLIDVQWITAHLARFGAIEISRREYLRRLERALKVERHFADEPPATSA
jgi:leucyl/phenylalanyl-tRNA--protein transferase